MANLRTDYVGTDGRLYYAGSSVWPSNRDMTVGEMIDVIDELGEYAYGEHSEFVGFAA